MIIAFIYNADDFWDAVYMQEIDSFEDEENNEINEKHFNNPIQLGIFQVLYHTFLFCFFAFLNYRLQYEGLVKNTRTITRVFIIININLFSYLCFNYLTTVFVNAVFIPNDDQCELEFILFLNLPIVLIAVVETYFVLMYDKIRQSEIEKAELKEENAKAVLTILKEQISPHFFFNTLNSLNSIIRNNSKKESLDFVENLSEVYRYFLDKSNHDLVTISTELEFITAYLFLLKKRFGENLQYQIQIDDSKKSFYIPPMALQMLVENAIKHNKLSVKNPLSIVIFQEGNYLVVQNNLNNKTVNGSHGIGLVNLNNRYQLLVNKEIEIFKSKEAFEVKIPIIKT